MRDATKMYVMKPIINHNISIELPTCMYEMKNIHSGRNGVVISDTGHVSELKENLRTFDQKIQQPSEMTDIVQQQERILQQLNELKNQMLSLRETLKSSPTTTSNNCSSRSLKKSNIKVEPYSAVIYINPLYPPYFLETLQKILKGTVNLSIVTHLHSTVLAWPKAVDECCKKLVAFSAANANGLPTISLRVILKEIDTQAQLLVSSVLIVGEVNILRYLSRTLPVLKYQDVNSVEIDSVLDNCYCAIEASTKTAKAKHINAIFKRLGKFQWLCGSNEYTIADIAAYTTLKHCDEKELNVTLTKYFEKCNATFEK